MDQGLALQARDVRMEYVDQATGERLLAIEKLDIDIVDGQFVSIVGPSGCGKSTFIKIVNGLFPATEGTIEIATASEGVAHAMVFQDSSLFPWYTIIDNVAYGLVCEGVPKKEARARAKPFIDMVSLTGFEEKFPYQLSGGMQQRANLARALTVDPEILLMDEPFAALDAQTRELMQAELLRIWNEANKTVLFITHQIDEAIYLSDRVLVMSARPGRILADITIDLPRPRELEIKRSPKFIEYADEIWRLIATQLKPHLHDVGVKVGRGGRVTVGSRNLARTRTPHPEGRRGLDLPGINERVKYGLIGFIIVLPLWELVVQLGIVKKVTLSAPSIILTTAIDDLLVTGTLWPHILQSSQQFVLGLGLALITGVPLGLALGLFRRLNYFLDPWLSAIYATPTIALVPLIVLVLGLGHRIEDLHRLAGGDLRDRGQHDGRGPCGRGALPGPRQEFPRVALADLPVGHPAEQLPVHPDRPAARDNTLRSSA